MIQNLGQLDNRDDESAEHGGLSDKSLLGSGSVMLINADRDQHQLNVTLRPDETPSKQQLIRSFVVEQSMRNSIASESVCLFVR
ncbi:uncharacterized protein N7500_001183 [Penicillium coprophilum]|uniref:uncharacterized protein n=1 Tax=Penicillium coprophilum TaxID=36646 RepID=UPI00239E06B8|nr:uncharacterized protein N7500_001183 [Penicillium coprophilum]KAJ5178484.1 hypothetical protein N7500_001183 [Penicillium coprophilum]